jgi:hypothetical protein
MTEENIIQIQSRRCEKAQLFHGPYLVDASLREVECKACGRMLNPIDVLIHLSRQESQLNEKFKRIQWKVQLADKKNRCKCENCGKMTRVEK